MKTNISESSQSPLQTIASRFQAFVSKSHFVFRLSSIFLFLILTGPFLMFFFSFFRQGEEFSLNAFVEAFGTLSSWMLVKDTLVLALGTGFFAFLVGLPLGFLLCASKIELRRLFFAVLVFPLCLPAYLWALGWEMILGPNGYLTERLWGSAGDGLFAFLFSAPGASFVFGLYYSGLIALSIFFFLRNPSRNFILNPGESLWKNFRHFLVSYAKTFLPWFCLFFVMFSMFREFGGSNLLGMRTISPEIFSLFSTFYSLDPIASIGLVTLLLIVPVWAVWEWGFKKKLADFPGLDPNAELPQIVFSKYAPGIFWGLLFLMTAFYFFPVWIFLETSNSIRFYWESFALAGPILERTLLVSAISVISLVLFSFVFCRFLEGLKRPWSALVEKSLSFIFFVPGILTGVLINRFWNHPWGSWIATNFSIVFLGFTTQYLYPVYFLSRFCKGSCQEEKGPSVFSKVVAIIHDGRMLGLCLIALILAFREMSTTLMLYPSGQETLLVKIFTLKPVEIEPIVASLGVVYLILVSVPYVILAVRFRKNF